MAPCEGVYIGYDTLGDGASSCWFLTVPGEACVDVCGSRPAMDLEALKQEAPHAAHPAHARPL